MTGVELIKEERKKQISKYGYDAKHDLGYKDKQLVYAAIAYLFCAIEEKAGDVIIEETSKMPNFFPFDAKFFKDEGKIENLKKAGAFIAAELDRLQEEESL